jgi:hypothetical protein
VLFPPAAGGRTLTRVLELDRIRYMLDGANYLVGQIDRHPEGSPERDSLEQALRFWLDYRP